MALGLLLATLGNRWLGSARTGDGPVGVLAVVDDVAITEKDFLDEIERRGGGANFASREARRQLLDDMIRLEVLTANARRSGYDEDPSVRREIKYVLAGKYRQEHLETELANVSVDDDEVADFYRRNEDRFVVPGAVHVAVLYFEHPVTASDEARSVVLERAAQVRAEAQKQLGNEHFGALAVSHSDDQASRYRGGDVGWLPEGQVDGRFDDAVSRAAFALAEPGDLSQPVATSRGVYLIRLLDRREAAIRPLQEVADEIRQRVLAAKREQVSRRIYDSATANVRVHVDEESFAAVDLPESVVVEHARRPPPLPQG
jgi:peptidylprolyl isomerase